MSTPLHIDKINSTDVNIDKINRIKRLVEHSLNNVFEEEMSIREITIFPRQKYDEKTNLWIPDSHAVYITINHNEKDKNKTNRPYTSFDSSLADKLEGLFGFEFSVSIE